MVVAGGVCVALGGCGGASASGGKGTLVVYNAQHPRRPRPSSPRSPSRPGSRSGSRTTTRTCSPRRSSRRAAGHPPTSSTPRTRTGSSSSTTRACSPPSTRRRWPTCRPRQRRQRRLGRGVGALQRAGLQPQQDHGLAAADVGDGPGRPAVEGQARAGAGGDRLLADRQLDRPRHGRRRPWRGSRGSRPTPGLTTTRPTTRRSSATSARARPPWG